VGVSRDSRNFSSTPYYLRNAQSYKLQICLVYSQGLSQQKPFKNLGEKGALAYPGTAKFFSVFPIISGMGKATKFKFGRYIHRVHANQRHLRMWEKRERWRIQGLDKYPLLSHERIKFGKYIQRVHANKRPLKI